MRGPQHFGHQFQQNLGFEGLIWAIFFFFLGGGGGGGVSLCNSYCKLIYQLLYCCVSLGVGIFITLSFGCNFNLG